MFFLNSLITNFKITIHAMLAKNISHDMSSGKSLLFGSLCASGIQRPFTSYWKLTCLGFSFTTLEMIAVAVLFAASGWQSQEMGNGKISGIQVSTHSYAIFQGIYFILFTCPCSFKSVENSSISQRGGLGCGYMLVTSSQSSLRRFE